MVPVIFTLQVYGCDFPFFEFSQMSEKSLFFTKNSLNKSIPQIIPKIEKIEVEKTEIKKTVRDTFPYNMPAPMKIKNETEINSKKNVLPINITNNNDNNKINSDSNNDKNITNNDKNSELTPYQKQEEIYKKKSKELQENIEKNKIEKEEREKKEIEDRFDPSPTTSFPTFNRTYNHISNKTSLELGNDKNTIKNENNNLVISTHAAIISNLTNTTSHPSNYIKNKNSDSHPNSNKNLGQNSKTNNNLNSDLNSNNNSDLNQNLNISRTKRILISAITLDGKNISLEKRGNAVEGVGSNDHFT